MATRGEFGCNQLSALLASQEVFGPNDYSPVGDVWFDETKHLLSSLGDPDKDSIVDLEQSEELEDLSGLGGDLGDTLDPDNKVNLALGRNVKVTRLPSLSLQPDLLLLLVSVLLDVLVSSLEDDLSLGLSLLLSLGSLGQLLLPRLLSGPPLLQQGLGDGDLLGGGGGGGDGHSCWMISLLLVVVGGGW